MAGSSAPEVLWQPSERAVEEAQVTQFARQVIRKRKLDVNTYPDFYRWTVENPEEFWTDVWDFCGVIASKRGSTVLVDGQKMPGYFASGGGGTEGTIDPLITRDGEHFAYLAAMGTHSGDKRALIVDGKEAIGFLVRVKQLLEDPARLMLEV